MTSFSRYLPFVAAMALVVVASNILVQFPVRGFVGGLALADILTWGAFTYPFSFLVTDLARTIPTANFFVGFVVRHAASQYPAAFDESDPILNRSWVAGDK